MNTVSREKPRRVPTIARSYIRLKLKTSIEREREEESVKKGKRDKREETVGNKKKNRNEVRANILHRLLQQSPRQRGRKKQARRRNSGCSGSPLYVLRTLPGCSESDRAPRLKPKFNWRNERREKIKSSWAKT